MAAILDTSEAEPLSRQQFRDVIGRFASGVTVITTASDGVLYGSTASAVSSLSDDPPMLLICLNRSSTTAAAINETGTFAVNVLAEDHAELARRFASKLPDKFDGVGTETASNGSPLIQGAIAHLVCEVKERVEAATHWVFIAYVRDAVAYPGHPLAYFRAKFGRMETAPDAAALAQVRDLVVSRLSEDSQPIDADSIGTLLDLPAEDVRRALQALTLEAIVRREGAGFVIEPIPEAVRTDYYIAKLAIEIGVANLTIGEVPTERLSEWRELMEATTDGLIADHSFTDPGAWVEANARFHEAMIAFAGSTILSTTYERLGLKGVDRRVITSSTYATTELAEDHRDVVEAFEQGDLERATAALREHAERPRRWRAAEVADGASRD